MRLHPGYGHYALERLLYRLSISAQRDQFLLKGALLFDLWFDLPHRPTHDADFLGFGSPAALDEHRKLHISMTATEFGG